MKTRENERSKDIAAPAAAREDARVIAALEEYLAALEGGRPIDRPEFLARHPEIASVLAECLESLEFVQIAAPQLHPSASAPLPTDSAGMERPKAELLGDFRILRVVGRGGMGVVYEAEQRSLGRRVALKVLPFAATMDPRHLQRFHNEARAAAALHHSNIVPVHAVGSERGIHYYAMQFIDGRTLAAVIAELKRLARPPQQTAKIEKAKSAPCPSDGRLPVVADTETAGEATAGISTLTMAKGNEFFRSAALVGVQAAEALDHAHQLGVVHRDIKPGNLLLDHRGNVWIADFGLAQVQGATPVTLTGDVVGTLRYMSPEQALAKRMLIDQRTDIYSLGVTLYELLTLRPAIDGENREEILKKIAFEEPIPPRRLNKAIAPELETILLKAMEKEPANRYATAKALADDLRCFLEDRPIQARRPSLLQRLRKWTRRHRAATISIVACLLVSLTVLAGSIGWSVADRAARRRAAEEKAQPAFEEAIRLQEQGKYADALAVAMRVEGLLDAEGNTELLRRVQERRKDLQMVLKLEKLRLETTENRRASDQRYQEAFREFGIDVDVLEPAIATDRIRERSICTELVVSLDSWAVMGRYMANRHRSGEHLLVLAGMVDTDAWRNRFRDAVLRSEPKAFRELATAEAIRTQPSPSLTLLGALLLEIGAEKEALAFLLRTQRLRPNDLWINCLLAHLCMRNQQLDDALRFAMIAVALRPDNPVTHSRLGSALYLKGQHEEAIAEFRETLKLDPKSTGVHYNLGKLLYATGRLDEAITEYHKAIEIDPKFAIVHDNLGNALKDKGRVGEAIVEFKKAIELDPKDFSAHYNLGNTLYGKGQLDEAIAEYYKAIELAPKYAPAHNNLGSALSEKGQLDEAIANYQKAIELAPKYVAPHNNLGNALKKKGRVDEAIAEFRKAIALDPKNAQAHYNLGSALYGKGRLDEAIAEFREAIRIQPDDALAHCNLGLALMQKGMYRQAVDEIRRGHDLGSRNTRWNHPSAQWLRSAEIQAGLNVRLPALLAGKEQAKDASERLLLAQLCQQWHKKRYAASARWYGEAFAAQPALASGNHYNAACAAALAGCGQGQDAAGLAGDQRARLRRQALDWLRAELEAFRRLLTKAPEKARSDIVQRLQHWQRDPDLASVRGSKALDMLPQTERTEWQRFWQEVEALRQRAATPPTDSRIRKDTD